MTTHAIVLERLTRVAPFGVRFWDAVTNRVVSDDLSVTAYLPGDPSRRFAAMPNRSGVYVLHHAPGLSAFTFGVGDEAFWSNQSPPRSFVIEVNDVQGRFQPMAFTAALPRQGIFAWEEPHTSPPRSVQPAVPLYSAPTRTVPGGMAVVRADLWDAANDRPAAWAIVEAWSESQVLTHAMADAQGRVAMIFPYPEAQSGSLSSPLGSPLGGGPRLLSDQTWPLRFGVFYSPRTPTPRAPFLEEVSQQAPVTLLETLSPPTPLPEIHLTFGKELIMKSQFRSELLVLPMGSPL